MMFFGSVAASRNFTSGGGGGGGLTYVDIPAAPAFSDTHTLINATTGNSIQFVDTNGKTDLLVGSSYPFLQFNGLSASYRMKSLDDTNPSTWQIIGSGAGNDYSLTAAVATPTIEIYNLRFIDSDNIIKMPGNNPGKTLTYQNIILEDGVFGGFLINENVAGNSYGNATFYFCRVLRSGGESFYLGKTGTSVQFYTGITTISHCYSEDSGREAVQCNGHADVRITNVTAYNGGLDSGSGIGQNNCFQIQNVYTGYMKKSIFWNFRAPAMISTNDFLFEDCFFGWTQPDREIYIQDMVANGYTEFVNPGGTITFRRCTFYNPDYTRTWMFRLQEENCNFVIEDCIFPTSVTTTVKDERSSTPYSLSETGSTFTDSPPLPTFGDPDEAEYVGYEKIITDSHHYDRGMGYRTP
jgi:hypothetical protein